MKAAWMAALFLGWLGAAVPASAAVDDGDGIARIERLQSGIGDGIARIERLQGGIAVAASVVLAQPERAWSTTAGSHQLPGAQQGRGWWRLRPVPARGARLLLVYYPFGARVTVLAPPDYRPQRASVFDAGLDAGHSRRVLSFALTDTSRPVYVGVEAAGHPLRVAVRAPQQFRIEDLRHVRVLWLSAGILVGVLLVTLLFWMLLRERVYLLFTATLLMQLLYVLLVFGEAYALLMFAWLAPYGVLGLWFVATVTSIVTVHFLLEFAELRARVPGLSRALWVVGALLPMLLLAALLSPWPRDRDWFPLLGCPLLLLGNALAIVTLLAAWRRGGRHAGFVLVAWVPLVSVATTRVLLLGAGLPLVPALEYGLPLMEAFAAVVLVLEMAHRMLTVRRERDAAKQDAEHDALTGVLNRAGTMQRLDRAIADSRRRRFPLSVLFLDIDHFKRINDTHGHAVGDACLRAVTAVIRDEMQPEQQLGRIGGEEFLLLMPNAARRHARDLAERIRQQVEAQCAKVRGAPVALTLSIGVVECNPVDSAASLLQRADDAMYQAKHEGRNRVVVLTRALAHKPADTAAP